MLIFHKPPYHVPVLLLSAFPFSLEVSAVTDLLRSIAVLLPELLDHRAAECRSLLFINALLFPVCFRHVPIYVWTGEGLG